MDVRSLFIAQRQQLTLQRTREYTPQILQTLRRLCLSYSGVRHGLPVVSDLGSAVSSSDFVQNKHETKNLLDLDSFISSSSQLLYSISSQLSKLSFTHSHVIPHPSNGLSSVELDRRISKENPGYSFQYNESS